jgi:hypothetical protein
MRLTEYLALVVIIGVFGWLMIDGANQLNYKFPANQINTSLLDGYDYIDSINEKVNNSYENFQTLGREDVSWFQKIGAGIVAIPYAVITFPIMIATAVGALMTMVTTGLGGIVPAIIILAMGTFLLIEIIKRLLEFYQRARA